MHGCAVIVIQSGWRGMKARRRAKQRREAAVLICRCLSIASLLSILVTPLGLIFPIIPHSRVIKGFIYRHEEYCPENEYFLDHVRCSFLKNLRKNLPKSVLDKSWPKSPPSLIEVKDITTHSMILMIYTQVK